MPAGVRSAARRGVLVAVIATGAHACVSSLPPITLRPVPAGQDDPATELVIVAPMSSAAATLECVNELDDRVSLLQVDGPPCFWAVVPQDSLAYQRAADNEQVEVYFEICMIISDDRGGRMRVATQTNYHKANVGHRFGCSSHGVGRNTIWEHVPTGGWEEARLLAEFELCNARVSAETESP